MPTKHPKANFIGEEGVDFIRLVCSRSNALFFERIREDIGIDGYIELLTPENHTTGILAHIQCKSGVSWITKGGRYQIKSDKKHFQTWNSYKPYPVIGIIYNPSQRIARWVDISKFLADNPNIIEDGPYIIEAPPNQIFNEERFHDFQEAIIKNYSFLGKPAIQELVDRYLNSTGLTKLRNLLHLVAAHPWSSITCLFLHQLYFIEDDENILGELPYFINMYRPHNDKYHEYKYPIPESIKGSLYLLAQKCLDSYTEREVAKILSSIYLIEHFQFVVTGIGYEVGDAIKFLTYGRRILCSIIGNSTYSTDIRDAALFVLIDFLEFSNTDFLISLMCEETNEDFRNFLWEALTTHFGLSFQKPLERAAKLF